MLAVCHDAGGAEMVSSYLRRQRLPATCVLGGPAVPVFERKLGHALPSPDLEEAVRATDWVLCGTGWQSDLEWRATRLAQQHGRRVIAFLDHWANYPQRFTRRGEMALPDELWVGDEYAHELARRNFPRIPVRELPNPYLEDVREELGTISPSPRTTTAARVLYVTEPISAFVTEYFGDDRAWGYNERDALEHFGRHIRRRCPDLDIVVVGSHPSEPPGKYSWAAQALGLPVTVRCDRSLLQEIVDADVVVGCETMAMVVALVAGKRVFTAIPPDGRPCQLPHPEIARL